ncbi:MAG TPA: 30S ribosomal protein S4 [bacterium]|nr:30S ribosomal protein S4 [bacterium]
MGRYHDAVCRLCRREGMKLYLKGEKCYTDKCPVAKDATPPGMHGPSRRKPSDFAVRLREKQRARRFYGAFEGQFKRYFKSAARIKGITGTQLLQLLETRLDNVVYRLGLGASRKAARQLVAHGHIAVNGRRVTVPSAQVRPGATVGVAAGSRDQARFKALQAAAPAHGLPRWLEYSPERLEGRVLTLPAREEIDVPVREQLIVEYYSR